MRILRSIADLALVPGPIVLAAGTFDGLHLGHQALVRRAMEEAALLDGTAVVMSFDRHPATLIRPDHAPKLLTRNETKLALLHQMGVSAVLLLEFNKELASIVAEEFIKSIAASAKPLCMICVGAQWSFGRGGAGNISMLEKQGGEWGFIVNSLEPVEVAGKIISSTRIRKALAAGNFHEVSSCLGRTFFLDGQVISGAGLGSKIGFPTANLDVVGMQLPPDGVYAVRVRLEDQMLHGVANIGVRPTVDLTGKNRTLEVHLFDTSEDFVGRRFAVEFVQFLRSEQKFPDLHALTAQIAIDVFKAKEALVSTFS